MVRPAAAIGLLTPRAEVFEAKGRTGGGTYAVKGFKLLGVPREKREEHSTGVCIDVHTYIYLSIYIIHNTCSCFIIICFTFVFFL